MWPKTRPPSSSARPAAISGTRVPEAARSGRLTGEALALRLLKGAISLLARAGFAELDAGVLKLAGPSGQEASIAAFAGDFFVSVHVGSSPTPTAV